MRDLLQIMIDPLHKDISSICAEDSRVIYWADSVPNREQTESSAWYRNRSKSHWTREGTLTFPMLHSIVSDIFHTSTYPLYA